MTKSPKRAVFHKTALKGWAFLSKAAVSFTMERWGTFVTQNSLSKIILYWVPLDAATRVRHCFKNLQYGTGQSYPKDSQVAVTVSGVTGHLQNAPLQGIAADTLWDSKAWCDFMYSRGWIWLTPEMVPFFILFQSVGFLWQTKMTSSFVSKLMLTQFLSQAL